MRLRWEYRPGSELFVVYNEERDTLDAPFPGSREPGVHRQGQPAVPVLEPAKRVGQKLFGQSGDEILRAAQERLPQGHWTIDFRAVEDLSGRFNRVVALSIDRLPPSRSRHPPTPTDRCELTARVDERTGEKDGGR